MIAPRLSRLVLGLLLALLSILGIGLASILPGPFAAFRATLQEQLTRETPSAKIGVYVAAVARGDEPAALAAWAVPEGAQFDALRERRLSVTRALIAAGVRPAYSILRVEWWRTCCEPGLTNSPRDAGGARVSVQMLDRDGKPLAYTFDVWTRDGAYWGEAMGYPARQWLVRDVYRRGETAEEPLYWRLVAETHVRSLGLRTTPPPPALPPQPLSAATAGAGDAPGVAACRGFAVYLVTGKMPLDRVLSADLASLPVEEQPVVSLDDVVSYSAGTHEMELTAGASERLGALRIPVSGLPFVVCAGGERIYAGAFWTPISSVSASGVVIYVLGSERRTFGFKLGYPGESFYTGKDPRGDPRILRALGAAGKCGECIATPTAATPPRTLADFAGRVSGDLTPDAAERAFGPPDEVTGSGLIIYVYRLEDGREVWIGFPGYAPLVYAFVQTPDGTRTELYRRPEAPTPN